MKKKFYSLKNILKKDCLYNVIFGERSNGKTFAVLKYGLEHYINTGGQLAIIRRWQDDFRGKRASTMFDSLTCDGNGVNEIERLTNGQWTQVYYYGGKWYLACIDETDGKIMHQDTPFAYAFSLSSMEHDKSTSYPKVETILFDEFMTRGMYLPDEFVLFMNVLSTIIRQRNNVKIFMCGNTVNQYCPYFKEMGFTNIRNMKQGDLDVYTYGESTLRVAVEFSDSPSKTKESDVYFAFNNPKLNMITGTGQVWEMNIYPHCPVKYKSNDIGFIYFIIFDGDILQCEIIHHEKGDFTFIHRKTTELKDTDADLIYSADYDVRPNWRRNITRPASKIEERVLMYFKKEKVFYQDNEVGEIIRNYLQYCGRTMK